MQSSSTDLPPLPAEKSLHACSDEDEKNEPSSQSSLELLPNSNISATESDKISGTESSVPNTKLVSTPTAKTRQKNDKPVEVCNEDKVVARFRTQTECARYLRATPEAVSYHCSKGGGVCNGLYVRPVPTSADENDSQRTDVYFGLFDGSSTHRPPARPQLSSEVVSMLKAWLLSPGHIDNPYPTGSEFDMLMETTKLDKTQLKHWFNNARKRIWKPLVKSEGRLIPKFGKVCKRTRGSGRKHGSDAASDDDSSPDADSSSANITDGTTTTKGGRKHTARKKKKGSDGTSTAMLDGDSYGNKNGSLSIADNFNMCHSIGMQQGRGHEYGGDSRNINNNNINMMMLNRYNQILGNMSMFSQGNGGFLGVMGGNPMMNSSMNRSMIMDSTAAPLRDSSGGMPLFGFGGSNNGGGGSIMGREGGWSSFQGCLEINDNASNQGRLKSVFLPSAGSNNGDAPTYCQPLIQPNSQDFNKNSHSAALIESVRSNAVFKQQVATMAMNEASTSFKDMEEAFARSKEILAQVNTSDHSDPENDVRVLEASTLAKKCQNVAMFKLKVSQRASEEAASAYDCYLRLVEDNNSIM